MRGIGVRLLAGVLAAGVAGGAAMAQDLKSLGNVKDAEQAVQDQAGKLVECTPERAAQDAQLKETTGVSTGCTPEKAAENEAKKRLGVQNPLR